MINIMIIMDCRFEAFQAPNTVYSDETKLKPNKPQNQPAVPSEPYNQVKVKSVTGYVEFGME